MRKSITYKKQNLLSALILAVVVLLTVIVCAIVGNIPPEANGSANVKLLNSGKVEMVLNVKKTEVSVENCEAMETYMREYFSRINSQSGDNDFVKLDGCEETETDYVVRISTRRIDKLKGVGNMDYGKGKDFSALSGNLKTLQEYYEGTIRGQFNRVYPAGGATEQRMLQLKKSDNDVKIQPIAVKSEERLGMEDFESYLTQTSDKIAVFRFLDLSFIDKLTVTVNGNIKYVSSQNVTLVDSNTVEITPMQLNASSEGETLTVDAMIGYIVWQENLSALAVCGICVGAELLLWFLIGGFALGWFKRFFNGTMPKRLLKYKTLFLMLIPGLALLIIFHYAPMFGLTTAFQDYDLIEGLSSEWVGAKYFQRIFMANTDRMYRIFRNTIFISLLRILSNFPIILLFALFINSLKNTRVKSIVQTISFIPYFMSWAAVAGLLYAIISDYGLLNSLLVAIGAERISFYGEVNAWWPILSISSLWKGMGWGTLIYISAMCNIDEELYEACALDGGGAIRKMITVTLPGIMPMVCMQLILDSSSLLKDNYEQILALLNGATGLKDTTEVIGQVAFDALKNGNGFGSATAIGMIQGVIGLILVFVTNKIVKKTDNPGII